VKKQEPGGSGDYGYDLVHDDLRGDRVPSDPGGGQEQRTPSPSAGTPDPGEDLGYDEAHDF
jgi:hypothetical protein